MRKPWMMLPMLVFLMGMRPCGPDDDDMGHPDDMAISQDMRGAPLDQGAQRDLAQGPHGPQWVRIIGTPNNVAVPLNVAITSSGDLLVAVRIEGNVDLGSGLVTVPPGNYTLALVKYGAQGQYLWSKGWAPPMASPTTGAWRWTAPETSS